MNVDILGMLGAGSGIDIQTLAKNLTEAERAPRQAVIDRNIERTEARIEGLSVLALVASGLRDAFAALKDKSDFGRMEVRNGAPTVFSLTAGADAAPGRHAIEVLQLAQGQRTVSAGLPVADPDGALNGGAAFSLSLAVGAGPAVQVQVTDATPQGVVDAINAAGAGVSAQLVDTGDGGAPLRIALAGPVGAAGAFTISSAGGVDFATAGDPPTQGLMQAAQDAMLRVDGLQVVRDSNTIDDLIQGATLQLFGANAGSAATVDLARDTGQATESVRALVTAYNDAMALLDELGRRDGGEESFSGALAGQPVLQQVARQVRGLFAADSSTPSGQVSALRDVGVTLDRNGRLQLDEAKLETALAERFDHVATMFSAGTENQSNLGEAARGLAGDAYKALDGLLAFDGALRRAESGMDRDLALYQTQLEALEVRMERVLERNIRQFTAMDALVGELQSMRESLAVQFENMSANLRGDR